MILSLTMLIIFYFRYYLNNIYYNLYLFFNISLLRKFNDPFFQLYKFIYIITVTLLNS